ncbi:MAG: IS91 family transposase [Burkholderiaceae bacterium]|nr:IS91 family transposase [Burkholderiaceae bacterium]
MIRLSSLIEQFEQPLLAQYGHRLLPEHRQALAAMKTCRSALSPRMQAHCPACEAQVFVPHSCGHRLCPHCQHHESQQWLERQLKALVPGEYFLLTFTLPAEFRALASTQPRTLYGLLMQCSWQTLLTFSRNDKHLQGTPGAVAVLHTHSRRLDYHPHVHVVMPAAAIDTEKRLWRTKTGKRSSGYLFNHKALAKVFRAKMLEAMAQAGLSLPTPQPPKWVVDCKHVGSGEKALVYLGRYLYRGVLQEKDILACDNGQVTFRYRNSKTRRTETRTLPGATFLWLLLQHVLPKGFRRARNFGFLHPNSKRLLQRLRILLKLNPGRFLTWVKKRPPLLCPCCGGPMTIIRTRLLPPFPKPQPPGTLGDALAM